MKTHIFILLSMIICLEFNLSTNAQKPEALTAQNPCGSKATCSECIQTPTCAWCLSPDFKDRKRCFQEADQKDDSKCPEEYIYNPANIETVILNKNMSQSSCFEGCTGGGGGTIVSGVNGTWEGHGGQSASGGWEASSGGSASASGSGSYGYREIVQVAPQRIKLQLRARQTYRVQMHYTLPKNYPVDLYYLMDLSKSMEDDKYKLSILGNDLAAAMRNLTRNFQLGFGSFVDKVVMPYVSTVKEKLIRPCESCEAPYGFRNHLSLNKNTDQFSNMVAQATVSGNLDAPEGGFDALMQAIVCKRDIGWRDNARHLLVFSTDAGFHYAGDGKLGGIVKPNDGHCHLDNNGLYTHSDKQDYPSISQINLKVKQHAINVIFAVTEEQIHIYKQLQANIEGASSGTLSNDSSNVVDFVRSQYEAISSTVQLTDNAGAHVKLTYYTSCLDHNGVLKETNQCNNIKVGNNVTFHIDVEVLSCPKDPKDWFQRIDIHPIGLNENLTLDLEMLCSCPCERPGNPFYIPKAPQCNYFGTYKCGLCECEDPYFGRHCECSGHEPDNIHQIEGNCIEPNSTVKCSGRGNCICGKCECHTRQNEEERIYGEFCQCDNFSCDRHEKQLCSGETHGSCECGVCQCKPPWGGPACNCRMSNETCFPKDVVDGEICSGHGRCVCGQCVCAKDEKGGQYSGLFCERCPTCTKRCDEFKDCVQCQMYGTGAYNESYCLETCTKFTPISVKHVEVTDDENENLCTFYDDNDCRFSYTYYYNEQNKIVIKAQEEPECPAKVFLLGIVLGVIAAIVLMGLAILLLWKLFTTIHDRREFAKFEKERMMAKWDTGENPIYKQATSTFKNPTYAGKG